MNIDTAGPWMASRLPKPTKNRWGRGGHSRSFCWQIVTGRSFSSTACGAPWLAKGVEDSNN